MNFENPPADPCAEFPRGFDDAAERCEMLNPNACALATVRGDGSPAARIVLLKEFDERGAVFYTNYTSRKAVELDANPRVALCLSWTILERQVRIEGIATRMTPAESKPYFDSRPRGSRIGAWASKQSSTLRSREELEQRVEQYDKQFPGDDVPLPDHWGGYRVQPTAIEFWQGRLSRLHDRLVFERDGDQWSTRKLYP